MSSAAAGGSPSDRQQLLNRGGPVGGSRVLEATNVTFDKATRGLNRVFMHVDDLLDAKPDISALAPIRKLLLEGESYAKQADTHLDFRRPDIALQDYIKASIIAVDIIPRHKDYPELIADQGELHRLYEGLQKRINSQHEKFEKVKDIIKENNSQSGVTSRLHTASTPNTLSHEGIKAVSRSGLSSEQRPDVQGQTLTPLHEHHGNENLPSNGGVALPLSSAFKGDGPRLRQKPPILPKPDALHGQAIKQHIPVEPNASSPEEDLAARFARLRRTESHSPTQDRRIQTQSVGMLGLEDNIKKPSLLPSLPLLPNYNTQSRIDRPLGPRDMPNASSGPPKPQKIPLDVEIPSMPKPPDAVYSPAWNIDDPANSNMLRSSSRNMYVVPGRSLQGVATNHTLGAPTRVNGPNDHASRSRNLLNGNAPTNPSGLGLSDIPTVTATELMEFLSRGSNELYLLLVDIRSREDFDAGHIMSHSIICIDPIILRKEISAEELGQSLVLSPEAEQSLFDTRDTFDLVIYYDQSSSTVDQCTLGSYGEKISLTDFTRAVYDYGYEKRLKRAPKLLVGGLDAWVDLVGHGALEVSQTSTSISGRDDTSGGQLSTRKPMARDSRRHLTARRMTNGSRPLSKEEENKWEAAIREDEASSDPSSLYVRTTEDFFRRFPEPSAIQESMVSPQSSADSVPTQVQQYDATRIRTYANRRHDIPLVPQIPVRPAPALPRQSYSGISERTMFTKATAGPGIPVEFRPSDTISPEVVVSGRAGLVNVGNSCYMNSVFQALKGTRTLLQFIQSASSYSRKPPRKSGETDDHPQIMFNQMKLLMQYLMATTTKDVSPKLIYGYINAIHGKNKDKADAFGNDGQHDAEEFLGFLLEVLEDELNLARDKSPLTVLTPSQEEVRRRLPVFRSSWMEWQRFKYTSNSFITETFRGQSILTQTCNHCGHESKSWDTWLTLQLEIMNLKSSSQSLQSALEARFGKVENMDDFRCDHCRARGSSRREQLSRCPEILIIMLRRHRYNASGPSKCGTQVLFPLDDLEMDPYFISLDGRASEKLERGHEKPLMYDCYAVIQHQGKTIRSGHYWTLLRDLHKDRRNTWHRFSDTQVIDVLDPLLTTQTAGSYVLFYQRQPKLIG